MVIPPSLNRVFSTTWQSSVAVATRHDGYLGGVRLKAFEQA